MAKFYGHELILGQVNLFFAVLIVAAVLAMMADRKVAGGLLFALAVVIKPYAVLFLPWLVAQRESRALLAAAGGICAALVLPVPIYGVHGTAALHLAWWQTVTESTAPNLLNADNVSLAAMFAKWLGTGRTAALAATVSAMLLVANAAAMFAVRRRVAAPAGLEAAMLLTMIPLLSPQGWDYVFLIATPAVVYLVNYDRDLPPVLRVITWVALAVIAFSLYDIVGRAVYARFMALSIISVCFLVVVSALTALQVAAGGVRFASFRTALRGFRLQAEGCVRGSIDWRQSQPFRLKPEARSHSRIIGRRAQPTSPYDRDSHRHDAFRRPSRRPGLDRSRRAGGAGAGTGAAAEGRRVPAALLGPGVGADARSPVRW